MATHNKILQVIPADGWAVILKYETGEVDYHPIIAWALCDVSSDGEFIGQELIAMICPESGPCLIYEAFDWENPSCHAEYVKDE
jgi:hypothetical protein